MFELSNPQFLVFSILIFILFTNHFKADENLSISLVKKVNSSAVEVQWTLTKSLAIFVSAFNLQIFIHNSSIYSLPVISAKERSTVIVMDFDKIEGIKILAKLNDSDELTSDISFRQINFWHSNGSQLIGCIELHCHDDLVRNFDESILAICFGDLGQELFVLTRTQLIRYNILYNRTDVYRYHFGDQITKIDYDRLNQLILVVNSTEIYQIDIRNASVFKVSATYTNRYLDAVVDPINGLIHVLVTNNSTVFYVSIPSVLSLNTSLFNTKIVIKDVNSAYSLLLAEDQSSLKLLGVDDIKTLFFENYTLSVNFKIKNQNFNSTAKLFMHDKRYLIFDSNSLHQFNEQSSSVDNIDSTHMDSFATLPANLHHEIVPKISMEIEDAFFGDNFLRVVWRQPAQKWQSMTRWVNFNYQVYISSEGSKKFLKTVGKEKLILQENLKQNTDYVVTIKIGRYSTSVTGRTLTRGVQKWLSYFMLKSGSVNRFKMDIRSFRSRSFEVPLKRKLFIKDLRVYNNCMFILLQNGSIIVKVNETMRELSPLPAAKFEVDHNTGNVIFIDVHNRSVYRSRQTSKQGYILDLLIQGPVEDLTLFPDENILAYLSDNVKVTDLNGFPLRNLKAIPLYNKSIICENNESVVVISSLKNKKILSAARSHTRCIASIYGVAVISDNGVFLRNWEGNSSLNLISSTPNISGIVFLANVSMKSVLLPSIHREDIKLVRNRNDEMILSWKPGKGSMRPNYLLVISNFKLNKRFNLNVRTAMQDIKKYGKCADQIEVEIRPYLNVTFADAVTRNFSIPCVTDSPGIEDLFAIKTIHSNLKDASVEMWANFSINANSPLIDDVFNCHLIIFMRRNSTADIIIKNQTISCLTGIYIDKFVVEKNFRFQQLDFCVRLEIPVSSIEKCIPNNILRTDNRTVILSYNQTKIYSFIKERIAEFSIDKDRKSLWISNENGSTRRILRSNFQITKIEIDWLRKTLFWDEISDAGIKLFSVYLNINKKDLAEDRILWFERNTTKILWTLDSIEGKLIISIKEKVQIYSLTAGPGWSKDHDSLVKCEDLIKMNTTSKCLLLNENGVGNFKGYILLKEKIIIYENLDASLCKRISIRENYVLPKSIESCTVSYDKNIRNMKSTQMVLNKIVVIDENGSVYDVTNYSKNFSRITLEHENASIEFYCFRYSGLLYINLSRTQDIYKADISYRNIQLSSYNHVGLLNDVLSNEENYFTITDFHPGAVYLLNLKLISVAKNSSTMTSLQCSSPSDVPDGPKNITIFPFNSTHSQISWIAGKDNGEKIYEYLVHVRYLDSNMQNYSLNSTSLKIRSTVPNLFVSIQSRNKLGFSKLSEIQLQKWETRKQIVLSESHFTMGYSTSLFLVIILSLAIIALVASIYSSLWTSRRNNVVDQTGNRLNRQNLELLDMAQNVKFERNCLYGFEKLPLSNFDKIPHILNECLAYSHLIGNGAFGMVFKGVMKVESDNCDVKNIPVALKIRNEKSISEEDFKREAILLFKYCHPNIIELYGVSFDCPDKQCLILEYMEKGNLRQYLQHHRPDVMRQRLKNNPKHKTINENSILDSKSLINIASDVLEALKYLEENHFVHRDIAARNCLVSHRHNNKRITKLGDFGLARDIYSNDYYRKTSETKLPVRWMAPETMKDGVFTGKSDVWAFGVLCWEIMAFGTDPYMGQSNSEVIKDVIAGKHLERPDDCPNDFFEMILQCWKYYPECRPNFSEIDLLFQYFEEIKDSEDLSTLSRLVIRSYNSCHDSEFGRNSEPATEKTSITLSDKYTDEAFFSVKTEPIPIRPNYDNLGYEVPLSPVIK